MRESRPSPQPGLPSWTLPAIIVAVILAIAIGFAGYEIGHRSSSAGPKPTPTALPSPRPTPTSIYPSPTPTATSRPVTDTPVPTPIGTSAKVVDESIVRAQGYVPTRWANIEDGEGGLIWAFRATCENSGDGYCQKVFFFHNKSLLGTDTKQPSRQILSVNWRSKPLAIVVTYANYTSTDPMCCPSGKPVTIAYVWNGSGIVASGTPPGD